MSMENTFKFLMVIRKIGGWVGAWREFTKSLMFRDFDDVLGDRGPGQKNDVKLI